MVSGNCSWSLASGGSREWVYPSMETSLMHIILQRQFMANSDKSDLGTGSQ